MQYLILVSCILALATAAPPTAAPTVKPAPPTTVKPAPPTTVKPTPPPTPKPTLPPTPGPTTVSPEHAFLDALIRRGDDLTAQVDAQMSQFHASKNYFVHAIEDELRVLNTLLADLREQREHPPSKINLSFLAQAELQVARHEGILKETLELAKRAQADKGFETMLELVDSLLARAYQDIGKLITHGKANEENVKELQAEIEKVEALETRLKSMDYDNTPEEAQRVVETLLEHERVIEEQIYKIEHMPKN